MILQNIYGENKIFIDDEVLENFELDNYEIAFPDTGISVLFKEQNILTHADWIRYNKEEDHILLFYDYTKVLEMHINENEIVSFSLENDIFVITTFKLPMFMNENCLDDKYPKFEVNISDCVYSMKIYLNNSEYIDIPYYESHNNIHSTLDYICKLIYFLDQYPDLINNLINNNTIEITIYNCDKDFDEKQFKGHGIYEYKIASDGVALLGEEFENGVYIVEWQKFFKLIMDTTWEIEFKNE